MHSFSLELGRKRVESNGEFQIFFPGITAQIIEEKIYFSFQKSNFAMKGASVKVAILIFFSTR